MDRVVWVGASPRGDADEVRSVVSSALAVGFTEIVLSKPDESLQRIGRFSAILLKGTTFVLSDTEIGRLATIRSPKDEHSVRAMSLSCARKSRRCGPSAWVTACASTPAPC